VLFPKEITLDYMKVLIKHLEMFNEENLDPENPITIVKLEDMMLERIKMFHAIYLKILSDDIMRLYNLRETYHSKKNEYRQKGIRLRSYQQYQTTVMTAIGSISYKRMALRPSSLKDKLKLKEIGVEGYIFPLDDALVYCGFNLK
jgi:cellobiose phosphorylase